MTVIKFLKFTYSEINLDMSGLSLLIKSTDSMIIMRNG